MAFPSSNTRRTLQSALDQAIQQAGSIKRIADNNRDRMASGDITSGGLLSLLDNIKGARARMTSHVPVEDPAVVQALVSLAQEQLGVDVEQDFNTMLGALDAATDAIIAAIPADDSGYLLTETMDADGVRTERTFPPAETAGIVAALDAVSAAIE